FLGENTECALCFHNVDVIYSDNRRPSHRRNTEHQPPRSTIHELFIRDFIATCSVMYRRTALNCIPEWYAEVEGGDWNLHLLAARSGLIGYISETLGAYRVHPGGVWSRMSPLQQWQYSEKVLMEMFQHFDPMFQPDIKKGLVNVCQYLAHAQA